VAHPGRCRSLKIGARHIGKIIACGHHGQVLALKVKKRSQVGEVIAVFQRVQIDRQI